MLPAIFLPLIITITVLFIFYKLTRKEELAHIPGPKPWPVIGSLHLIRKSPHQVMKRLAFEYGDVMKIKLATRYFIVVSSMEGARESLITKASDFAGRPQALLTGQIVSRDFKDITFGQNNAEWKALRTLVHKAVKVYGERGELLETIIHQEANELIKRFLENKGKEIWPQEDIDWSVLNIINAILFKSRFERNDPKFIWVKEIFDTIFQCIGRVSLIDLFPSLKMLRKITYRRLLAAVKNRDSYIRDEIREHQDSLDVNNLRDFVDYLLAQKREYESSKLKILTSDHYELAVFNVFSGGMETSATSLGWTIALLGKNPDIQEKGYCEIKSMLGDRLPSTKDKDRLSYIRAIVHESLRLHPPIPLGVPHTTTCDTSIKGLKIPKGVGVIYNLYAIGTDATNWEDPLEFKPERWLDEDGKFNVSKNDSFMPFSSGHRVCIGAALAKTELFLFTALLIQRLKVIDRHPNDGLKCIDGSDAIWRPTEYLVSFKERKDSSN